MPITLQLGGFHRDVGQHFDGPCTLMLIERTCGRSELQRVVSGAGLPRNQWDQRVHEESNQDAPAVEISQGMLAYVTDLITPK